MTALSDPRPKIMRSLKKPSASERPPGEGSAFWAAPGSVAMAARVAPLAFWFAASWAGDSRLDAGCSMLDAGFPDVPPAAREDSGLTWGEDGPLFGGHVPTTAEDFEDSCLWKPSWETGAASSFWVGLDQRSMTESMVWRSSKRALERSREVSSSISRAFFKRSS